MLITFSTRVKFVQPKKKYKNTSKNTDFEALNNKNYRTRKNKIYKWFERKILTTHRTTLHIDFNKALITNVVNAMCILTASIRIQNNNEIQFYQPYKQLTVKYSYQYKNNKKDNKN